MVITARFARTLFNDSNPLGKTVEIRNPSADSTVSWGSYTVTGVIRNDKNKSHLQFDALISSSSMPLLWKERKIADLTNDWHAYHSYTYALLGTDKSHDALITSLDDVVRRKRNEVQDIKGFTLIPQLLTSITPGILVGNETSYTLPLAAYYFLGALALVILVSACLNYTNLSTARALTRAKEIGVRKVTGAFRRDLVFQFLSEAILTAFLSLAMATAILFILKEAFLKLWMNQYLDFSLEASVPVYLLFVAFALFTGLISGFYPALYLSRFQPIKALKNIEGFTPNRSGMRKLLAVSQFVVSLFFITTSLLLVNQFRHFMEFEYGFNPKNIVNVSLQGNNYRKVANGFSAVAGVSSISACNYLPSTGTNNGISLRPADTDGDYQKMTILITDENFVNNLEIKLIAGKHLEPTDSANRFLLVNSAAVKAFGYHYPGEIIGKVFESEWGGESVEVIGVVEDFFVKMPMSEDQVVPLVMRNKPHEFSFANIKIVSLDLMGTVRQLEKEWRNIDPHHPFQYEFYDDQLASMHQGLFDLVSMIGFIAFIAITIACLGLLGMSAYTAERKKKEVGIRKVLGAPELGIALLLSKDFLKIIGISIFFGAPLSFFVNDLWLQKFPNRVEFGITTILLGVLILLALGVITIGSQTITASKRNPVDVLKME
jgi:putative ABC transport system permease protein